MGLEPGQLLVNEMGERADILAVNPDGTVTLGILSRGIPITVPRAQLIPKRPHLPVPFDVPMKPNPLPE